MFQLNSSSNEPIAFDLLVFIGRFQPLHFGHLNVLQAAAHRAKNVLVLVGSANSGRSVHNPFSYAERSRMITDALMEIDTKIGSSFADRIIVKPLNDHLYNDQAWLEETQALVYGTIADDLPISDKKPVVGLIGHRKDNSSYYLKMFPTFLEVAVPGFIDASSPTKAILSSTSIRKRMFEHVLDGKDDRLTPFHEMSDVMPTSVRNHLDRIWRTAPFQPLFDKYAFADKTKKAWANSPYPVTFTTVDSVVVCNGHVLMVERGENPGKGELALPGGFLNQTETLFDGALRELQEETQIKIPRKVLVGAAKSKQAVTFDDPHRSTRGRTITHAFRFDLVEKTLPDVKAGDDAVKAMWIPLAKITPDKCFEDHGHIIRRMLEI